MTTTVAVKDPVQGEKVTTIDRGVDRTRGINTRIHLNQETLKGLSPEQAVAIEVIDKTVHTLTSRGGHTRHVYGSHPKLSKAAQKFYLRAEKPSVAYASSVVDALIMEAQEEILSGKAKILVNEKGKLSIEKGSSPLASTVLINFLNKQMDIFVLPKEQQGSARIVEYAKLPFSPSLQKSLQEITQSEGVVVLLAKAPPPEVAKQIIDGHGDLLSGITSLWKSAGVRELLKNWFDPSTRQYLDYATVRVVGTSRGNEQLAAINQKLEEQFEDEHKVRLLNKVYENHVTESLTVALGGSVGVVATAEALASYFPEMLHKVTGVLDDIALGIIPQVSHKFSHALKESRERKIERVEGEKSESQSHATSFSKLTNFVSDYKPLLGEIGKFGLSVGLVIPIATKLGALSSTVVNTATSSSAILTGGALFGIACCAGPLITSAIDSFSNFAKLKRLSRSPEMKDHVLEQVDNSFFGKTLGRWAGFAQIAVKNAVLETPFRAGALCIGAPLQVAGGALAASTGLFHTGWIIGAIGIAESACGILTNWLYPKYAHARHLEQLKKVEAPKFAQTKADASVIA